ncbi:MAG: TVP38/TMEM64 family protein [Thermodesulfobacteriota bacterium]
MESETIFEPGVEETPGKRGSASRVKLLLGVFLVAALFVLARQFSSQDLLKNALEWVRGLGPTAPLSFLGIYVLATVLFLPGSVLTLGAGVVFGLVKGSVICSISSTLGATCAFLVGRYLARGWVETKIDRNPKFKVIDEAVAREGWKIVGLTRLSPIFPFNLLNYAYGVTKVPLRGYFFASWIGMLPGTVMYVYIGTLAGDLATLSAGGSPTATTAQWVLRVVGLAATLAVTVYVTRTARKALAARGT